MLSDDLSRESKQAVDDIGHVYMRLWSRIYLDEAELSQKCTGVLAGDLTQSMLQQRASQSVVPLCQKRPTP